MNMLNIPVASPTLYWSFVIALRILYLIDFCDSPFPFYTYLQAWEVHFDVLGAFFCILTFAHASPPSKRKVGSYIKHEKSTEWYTCICSFCCFVTMLVVRMVAKLLVPWSVTTCAAAQFIALCRLAAPSSPPKFMNVYINHIVFCSKNQEHVKINCETHFLIYLV